MSRKHFFVPYCYTATDIHCVMKITYFVRFRTWALSVIQFIVLIEKGAVVLPSECPC